MDQAIYFSNGPTQKIFGVRGQWVFQFNPVTGVLENSLRFKNNVAGVSTIAAVGASLYIGVSWQPIIDWSASPTCPDSDIYIVDAASFTVSGRLNLFANISPSDTEVFFGWRTIAAGGNGLIGYYMSSGGAKLFNYNIGTTAFTSVAHKGVTDIAWDSTNGVIWLPSSFDPDIYCYDPNFSSFNTCFDTNGNLNTICGICYNSATNKVYAVDGTFNFYSFSAALAVPGFTNFHVNTFNSGRINCNAFRIKSVNGLALNPFNGKILMPTWADDAVLVIDPATDTVSSIKTGFTAPFDVVSTPNKNFAVQSGVTGLKEII